MVCLHAIRHARIETTPIFIFKPIAVLLYLNEGYIQGRFLLHVSEVPTPLGLPFALFPNTKGRRSGVIFPEPGEAPNAGFFLKGGGYFWAINDGFTLTTTADLYSRGLFGINTDVQYKKRYKRSGRLQWSYFLTPSPNPDQADSKPSHDVRLTWSHQMDPKATTQHVVFSQRFRLYSLV